MTRDEIVASLCQCFNVSSSDSDINIVRIHHLLDLVAEAKDKEIADLYEMCLNQAKTIKQYIEKFGELK